MVMTGNTPYVAARAKSRRQKLADRARLRQLISQSPDQLTVAIGDTLLQDRNWSATDVLRTLAVNVIRYREENR